MNMAARMESTGARNRIHISSDTADLLKTAGKASWIEIRKELVDIKGKGSQRTYWVKVGNECSESSCSGSVKDEIEGIDRNEFSTEASGASLVSRTQNTLNDSKIARLIEWNVAVLTQRLQAISRLRKQTDEIDPVVIKELKAHVEGIESMYRKNPFHNFEVSMERMNLKLIICCIGTKLLMNSFPHRCSMLHMLH